MMITLWLLPLGLLLALFGVALIETGRSAARSASNRPGRSVRPRATGPGNHLGAPGNFPGLPTARFVSQPHPRF